MPTYTNDTDQTIRVPGLDGRMQAVPPGGEIETYKLLGTGWTKTADTPWYPLATYSDTVTAPGTAEGLIDQNVIRVMALADGISMTAGGVGNPFAYPLTKNVAVDIANDGEIDVLAFDGAGDVLVIGLPA